MGANPADRCTTTLARGGRVSPKHSEVWGTIWPVTPANGGVNGLEVGDHAPGRIPVRIAIVNVQAAKLTLFSSFFCDMSAFPT
jgi:hypothetical protein